MPHFTAADYQAAYARVFQNNTLSATDAAALAAQDAADLSGNFFANWADAFTTNPEVVNSTGAILKIWNDITGAVPSLADLAGQVTTIESEIAKAVARGSSSAAAVTIAYKAMGASLANSASFNGSFELVWNQHTSTGTGPLSVQDVLGEQAFVQAAFQFVLGRDPSAIELGVNVAAFEVVRKYYAATPVAETAVDARAKGEFIADLIKQAFDFSIGPNADLPQFDEMQAAILALANGTYIPGVPITSEPGAPPTNVGLSFVLTTAQDISGANLAPGTANNDTFFGVINWDDTNDVALPSSTANPGDHLDGAGGLDTLDVTVVGNDVDSYLFLPHTTSVENLTVEFAGSGTLELDAAFMIGLQSITLLNPAASIEIQNIHTLVDVNLINPSSDTYYELFSDQALFGAGSVLNLNVQGTEVNDGTQYFSFADVNLDYAEIVHINSTGGRNGIELDVNEIGTQGTKTINVDGNAHLTLDFDWDTTFTVQTIDASKMTGGGLKVFVYNDGSTGVQSITGSGFDDAVFLEGFLAPSATVNLGAGNDAFIDDNLLGPLAVSGANGVDGGAGKDTVSLRLIEAGNGALFKNFEIVDLSHAGNGATIGTALPYDVAALLPNSTITGVAISDGLGAFGGDANVVVSNVGFADGLLVTGEVWGGNNGAVGNVTLNFAGATGAADVYNITFNDMVDTNFTSRFNTLSINGMETVNIASGGDTSNFNWITHLKDANVVTINITGATDFELDDVQNASAQTGPNHATTLTKVDGSTATGDLTIDLNDQGAQQLGTGIANYTLALLGGKGNDVLSVDSAAAYTKVATINANIAAGGNDTINDGVQVGTGFTATNPGSILNLTGANAGDVINFDFNFDSAIHSANVATAINVVDAINMAEATTTAGNDLVWFAFGGNTYVVSDTDNNQALSSVDQVVKLTGIYDLNAHSTVSVGFVTLT